ncbi:hypothetical protein IWQ60_003436 [Tieghemiomyces parasiticus]|uniref:Chloride channel protein n=1 Tax=Tieghemiomyces parasiticus TaxID=78921 RepID=A0A9W8DWF9_9FUNG|nr:hypothetical protein IWQ60_003436 [Tieghemiomyces parasiticus]
MVSPRLTGQLRHGLATLSHYVFFDLHLYLLLGIALGVIASFIDISYEWLNDFREGYCQIGFYLNQRYCCWAEKSYASCAGWVPWSQALGIQSTVGGWLYHYLVYIISGICLAGASSMLVIHYAPYASRSGIPEIKAILGGTRLPGFLGFRTLVVKVLGTILAVASGLCVGKEGPLVHIASCCGHVMTRGLHKFRTSETKFQEVISVASAAGISVAFGAPIGGVLFSLEELSYYFPSKTMWRSFFCAMVASMMLKFMNPFRTGKLVAFQVTYDRAWHGFELGFFVLLGVLGGLLGAAIIRLNLHLMTVRQRPWVRAHPLREVLLIAAVTSVINFLNILLRVDTVELVSNLFTECEDMGYEGICDPGRVGRTVALLTGAAVLKTLMTAATYGIAVPGGILMPAMAIGACTGRAVGILVQVWHRAFPALAIFRACAPDVPCVTPGVYALVGAAATLAGVTRMTITTVVVVFELTGALIYVLPIMVSVMVSKWVGDAFGRDGIFDGLIKFYGYPYLGPKVGYHHEVLAQDVMTRVSDLALISTTAATNTLDGLRDFIDHYTHTGFPIVKSHDTLMLVGWVSRTRLAAALERALTVGSQPGDAVAYFGTDVALERPVSTRYVDLQTWTDPTPIAMSPLTPMFLIVDTFKQLALHHIIITQNGRLLGLITKKDVLRHLTAVDHDSRRIRHLPGLRHTAGDQRFSESEMPLTAPVLERGPSNHHPAPVRRFASISDDGLT